MEEILHQLREVGSLSTIIHRVLAPSIPSAWEWDFWTHQQYLGKIPIFIPIWGLYAHEIRIPIN